MRWKFCIQFGQAARVRRDAHCDGVYGRVPKRDSYLSALIRRLAARRGSKRATMGVGHAILVIACHLLKRKQNYIELGINYFDEKSADALKRSLVRRLERLVPLRLSRREFS